MGAMNPRMGGVYKEEEGPWFRRVHVKCLWMSFFIFFLKIPIKEV